MWPTKQAGAPSQPLYGAGVGDSAFDHTRDLIGEMATAARAHGLLFGAYFSKADWHAGDYWNAPQGALVFCVTSFALEDMRIRVRVRVRVRML
jgi:hypothetical protein